MDLIKLLGISGFSVAVVAALLWFLRHSIQSWIWKEHTKELEEYKSSLATTTELLKFELQKDSARSQLYSSSIFTIYPELFQKVRIAHGIVSGIFGFRYANSWDGFNKPDFEKILADRNVPTGKRDELISAIETDRGKGLKNLDSYLWEIEFSEAQRSIIDLKNYALLKEVFISTEIKDLCLKIHKDLISAKVDSDISRRDNSRDYMKQIQKTLKDCEEAIDNLSKAIHKELNPPKR